ncbi:MAG TPA: folylpolyglutamate synthase/dihydrofolate synthase family protein [Mycobacteriales bacterium]|nr:folylpolyglutamate synthase/dihydrofolate synthase family protein [Mycobacteriales bacterium]
MTEETAAEAFARVERALAQRIPGRDEVLAMQPDITRITEVMDLLGSPQRSYPAIHLTGTNGKTSTTRMVDALLRGFGLRPGRYTSPHLATVRERIAVDGVPLDEAAFAAAYDDVAPYLDLVDSRHPLRVTYFETLTAMAYAAFADAPVDVAVVEVGMGGQWDATNVLHAATCVVTPVSLDHPELGSTVTEVATEKAGIVHEGARVISGVQTVEAAEVLVRRAAEVGAELAVEGVHFGVTARSVALGGQLVSIQGLGGLYEDVFLPLHGAHQASNAACALAAVESFLGGGAAALDVDAVRAGFALADSPGRLEVVRRSPTVLLDGAHNPGGVAALVTALGEAFAFDRVVGVVAVLADKDAHAMLSLLEPVLSDVVVTSNRSPRGLPVDDLARVAVDVFGPDRVTVEPVLPNAIDAAVALADESPSSGVLVTGSLYTVGEARTLLVG